MRFEAIDGLRAFAAMIVAFGHAYRTGIIGTPLEPVLHTPLAIFIAGDAAVLLFFVMSGFFIALPSANGKSKSYADFVVNRFIRIYIPYIVAVFVAALAVAIFAKPGSVPGMSAWFNVLWQSEPTFSVLMSHVFMLGEFDANIYDPVLWAMVIEMRMAFIAPFMVLFVARFGPAVSILTAMAISYGSFWAADHFGFNDIATAWWRTFSLMTPFAVGMSLAFHKDAALKWVQSLGRVPSFLILTLAICLMPCAYWLGVGIATFTHYTLLSFAAVIIVIFALDHGLFYKFLSVAPLRFVGKISYTFYLWHFIILLSMIYSLHSILANELIFAIWLVIVFPLSNLMYKLVEEPSAKLKINIGRLAPQKAQ